MIQQYITYYFAGLVYSEEQTTKVANRDDPAAKDIPAGSFGYRFFERQLVQAGGEELTGPMRNFSGYTYFGRAMTLAEVEAEYGKDANKQILISNLRNNNYQRVCQTELGNWRPMEEGDRAIKRPELPPPPATKELRFEALAAERGMDLTKKEDGTYADEHLQACWLVFESEGPGA